MEILKTAIEIGGFLATITAVFLWAASARVKTKGYVEQRGAHEGGTGIGMLQSESNARIMKAAFSKQSSLSYYAALVSAAAAIAQGALIALSWTNRSL